MKATLQTTLNQRLTLTPQLSLSLKILAMNRIELDHYLEECIERNPMLESLPPQNEAENEPEAPRREVADQAGDNRWERLYQRGNESYDRMAHIQDQPTLCEALHLQLDQQPMSDDERILAHAIVDSLDDDGLFRADPAAFSTEHGIDEMQLEHVLTQYIQTLEPAGIGARDITECLLLQLDPANPADRNARMLLLHFQHLLGEDETTLLKASGLQPEQLRAAMERMRRLDPFPGHDLGGQQGHIYVEPEILFIKNATGGIDVEIPRSAFHRIHLNQRWQNAQWSGADKKFVDTAMQEANWIIHGLTQRRETLMKLGLCLARRQKRLLDIGFLGIKPLTMREVAEELGMHESTISRVVQGKYAATPVGTMPLKAFFSTGLQTRSGGTISSFRVQQRIKALIDSEHAEKPISDQQIAEKLQHEGIEIARRTVAKYREQIGLPSSSQRRRAAKSRQNQMRR